MCGRFSLATATEAVEKVAGQKLIPESLPLRYNIAPTQKAYVITSDAGAVLQQMTWGLIPHWDKHGMIGGGLINARMESVLEKPSFRDSVLHRRCLVPADSFYEWRKVGQEKIPYRIMLTSGELMVMAGIWDRHISGGQVLTTFCILTAPANLEVREIHDRMPLLLLTPEARDQWLRQDLTEAEIAEMLLPPPDGILKMYRVSDKVSKAGHEGPELHEAADEQLRLF